MGGSSGSLSRMVRSVSESDFKNGVKMVRMQFCSVRSVRPPDVFRGVTQ